MARAPWIYYVQNTDGKVIAAFTVKHQLADWLERKYGPAEDRHVGNCPVGVYRITDGYLEPDAQPIAYSPRTLDRVS